VLTKLSVRNFKLFEKVELELGDRVVLIGPNNSGKTSALQALALWDVGVKRWAEKRGAGDVPEKRPGVTINRRDLIAAPVPSANLLWRDLHVRQGVHEGGKTRTQNILVEVAVEGVANGAEWACPMEFDYANEESFYCRPQKHASGGRTEVPAAATGLNVAYLPPMSGLAPTETRLDQGAINVRLGEGRTAEVLRNLCFLALSGESGAERWKAIVERMESLFGCRLEEPSIVKERSEIVLSYRTRSGARLDISASGRGQQQTLLLLAHMTANPGAILLLDEPDAHLEILRQRQIYEVLTETATRTGSQIIAASHSEVLLTEAADRDIVIAFVGTPHRIDDRGSQVLKALREIGFDQYYQAEETGWVLYLEGSTDLAILSAFAKSLAHPARELLERPFVHYVANHPKKAQEHFYGLREAKKDLIGVAIYDRLDQEPPSDPNLKQSMWRRRELENYLATREAVLAFAEAAGREAHGELFGAEWRASMDTTVGEIESALSALGKPGPWSPDIKASDEFLEPLFRAFYRKRGLPDLMRKTNFHVLARFVPAGAMDAEIVEKLDLIVETASRATPRKA
jgi:hypothetical protein